MMDKISHIVDHNNEVFIYYADCKCFYDQQIFDMGYKQLPNFRKELVDNFVFIKDKALSMGAWLLLNYALKQHNASLDKCEYKKDKNGKPYISNCNLKFNLSHSGDKCICALSNFEIGCDIEKIDTFTDDLAKMCIRESEIENLNSIKNTEDKQHQFFRYWTLKESFMKTTGYGLTMNPLWIQFDLNEKPLKVSYESKELVIENLQKFHFKELHMFDDYCASVCCEKNIENLQLLQIEFPALIFS